MHAETPEPCRSHPIASVRPPPCSLACHVSLFPERRSPSALQTLISTLQSGSAHHTCLWAVSPRVKHHRVRQARHGEAGGQWHQPQRQACQSPARKSALYGQKGLATCTGVMVGAPGARCLLCVLVPIPALRLTPRTPPESLQNLARHTLTLATDHKVSFSPWLHCMVSQGLGVACGSIYRSVRCSPMALCCTHCPLQSGNVLLTLELVNVSVRPVDGAGASRPYAFEVEVEVRRAA